MGRNLVVLSGDTAAAGARTHESISCDLRGHGGCWGALHQVCQRVNHVIMAAAARCPLRQDRGHHLALHHQLQVGLHSLSLMLLYIPAVHPE